MKKTTKGVLIASAVASMFVLGAANAQEKAGKDTAKAVKCAGINECKGKAACSGPNNSCAGENSCKGKGWIKVGSEKECKDKGGTIVAAKK